MRRAGRVDQNQAAIVAALEAAGCAVQSLAGVGAGVPDLLVWVPATFGARPDRIGRSHEYIKSIGRHILIECKAGSGFTPAQKKFHSGWPGPLYVANSVEDALLIVGAK